MEPKCVGKYCFSTDSPKHEVTTGPATGLRELIPSLDRWSVDKKKKKKKSLQIKHHLVLTRGHVLRNMVIVSSSDLGFV